MKLVLFALPFLALPAHAADVPRCAAPFGVATTNAMADFPLPVAHSLTRHIPNLSAPDAPFNGGDALQIGQTQLDRRLITAFHRGSRWVIAYEAAGIGYHHVVVAYDVSDDGKTSHIASKTQVLPGQTCEVMTHALDENGPVDRYW